jgi:epidermal growth factor receptor substrate 15
MAVNLSADEKRLYGQLFKQCDPEGLGIVTGEVARTLFERSGLSPQVLGEIWQYSDTDNNGFLDQVGFSQALRLIGHIQTGKRLSPVLADSAGPLPEFDGRARPDTTVIAPSSPIAAPAPRQGDAGSPGSRVPTLSPADRQRFVSLFEKSAPGGVLDGEQARSIFLKARLPNETLGQIWNLADTQSRGRLNQQEFVIAMHLIQCTLNNSMPHLPANLPPALLEAAAGGRSSHNSYRTPSTSSLNQRVQLPQPVPGVIPRQYSGGSAGRQSPAIRASYHTGASGDWVINAQEKARFDGIFESLDKQKTGVIGAKEVVPFLTTSELPEEVLAQVWDLADVRNTGQFGKAEFAIAMFLVQQKLTGKDLPPVLPPSLMMSLSSSRGSRQGSTSSVNLPNPVFLPPDRQPLSSAPAGPSVPPLPVTGATSSSLNDLVSLNDLFASPSPPVPSFKATTAPAPQSRQFVPSSSFGQALARNDTGSEPVPSRPEGLVRQDSGKPMSRTSTDLLATSDDVLSSQLSTASTDVANLSNQLGSLTSQTVGLTQKREKQEAELSKLLASKKEVEQKLASLRANYDSEVQKVHQVQELLDASKKESTQLSQDYSILEASLHALQDQYQDASNELAKEQQGVSSLREKILAINEETANVRLSLETAQKESKQLKSLNAVSQKQVSVAEEERDKVTAELESVNKEIETETAVATERAAATQEPGPSYRPHISSPSNPFANFARPAEQRQPTTGVFGTSFEDSFRQMDVASPSTAEPTRSSVHDTEDTPGSSPPASTDFQGYPHVAEATIPTFTLPLARPGSATSSVQNNAPMSVRGDLDGGSRPESPADTTTEPVSGIVPPESLELEQKPQKEPQKEAEAEAGPIEPERANDTSETTVAPPEARETEESGESFEFVDAEDNDREVPGSFPWTEAATSSGPPARSHSEEFPPIQELEPEEESSSDEETYPVKENVRADSDKFVTPQSTGEPGEPVPSTAQQTVPAAPILAGPVPASSVQASVSAISAESVPPSSVPTGPVPVASVPAAPVSTSTPVSSVDVSPAAIAAPVSASASEGPLSEPVVGSSSSFPMGAEETDFVFHSEPKPSVQYDPFGSAFSGLSEAKADTGDFGGFDEFNSTFTNAFPSPKSNQASSGNDEWEQLFAGFSVNPAPSSASTQEIREAFQLPPAPRVAPAKPTTPRSQAVAELTGMGFSEQDALDALKKKNYNLSEASNYLLDR